MEIACEFTLPKFLYLRAPRFVRFKYSEALLAVYGPPQNDGPNFYKEARVVQRRKPVTNFIRTGELIWLQSQSRPL